MKILRYIFPYYFIFASIPAYIRFYKNVKSGNDVWVEESNDSSKKQLVNTYLRHLMFVIFCFILLFYCFINPYVAIPFYFLAHYILSGSPLVGIAFDFNKYLNRKIELRSGMSISEDIV